MVDSDGADAASSDVLVASVRTVSWALATLSRSLTGLALVVLAGVILAWSISVPNAFVAAGGVVVFAYAVSVLTLQARNNYTDAATPLPALLGAGLDRLPALLGIVFLCGYAVMVVGTLGLGILALFAVAVIILGPELGVLLLTPVIVHLLTRLAIAVPMAVLDGAGPLAALEAGVETAPPALPQLFGVLGVVAGMTLVLSLVGVLTGGLSGPIVAFVAGGLSAVAVTATTRVYLDVRDDDRAVPEAPLRTLLRQRLR